MKQSIFFSLMLFLATISFLSCDDYLDLDILGGWYPSTTGETVKAPNVEDSANDEDSADEGNNTERPIDIVKPTPITMEVNGVSFNMIPVEAGTFLMGSDKGTTEERPVHSVTISKDYYIGETEVTQALWRAVMASSPITDVTYQWNEEFGLGDSYPAYFICWEDCKVFIERLNELTGYKYRMPTEAEWEFAARGGNSSNGYNYCGSNTIDNVAWYKRTSGSKIHPIRSKLDNELGIYDMSGNVCELVADRYGAYSADAAIDPTGPATGIKCVHRGGCWNNTESCCTTYYRGFCAYNSRENNVGFRLALSSSK